MKRADSEPSDRALGAGERAFREMADFAPVMIWTAGPDRTCDWFNRPWLEFVGRTMEEEIGLGWAQGVHPEDRHRCIATHTEAFDTGRPFGIEYRLRRHDGEYRWMLGKGAPFSHDGALAGCFGSCVDVTPQRQLEERQRLLADELDHRVKNMLATVQSLARQSLRPDTPGDLLAVFDGRLQALAAAHTLLTGQNWISLEELVRTSLTLHRPADVRWTASGPMVRLSSKMAISFIIALHELGANARRFGALSGEAGTVDINWSVIETPEPRLMLVWQESGGPPVEPPARRGFGTLMLERTLATDLGGHVGMQFAHDGLCCHIDAPLPVPSADIPFQPRGDA